MSIKEFFKSYGAFIQPSVQEPAHTLKDNLVFVADYSNKRTRAGLTTLSGFDWDVLYSMSLTEKQHQNLTNHRCITFRDVYDCTGINLIPEHYKPNRPPKFM